MKSSVLVKLLYVCDSTKDKLPLKHLYLLMATFGISKDLVVTLKYYYEKNMSGVRRNQVEIMFAL